MSHIKLAISFILENGDETEQARLNVLLGKKNVDIDLSNFMARNQREDGSWPPLWAPQFGSIDATCYHLAQCEQLGLDGANAFIQKAVTFLTRSQHSDGYFEEHESLSLLAPPWVKPGDTASRCYLTANAGLWTRYFGLDSSSTSSAHQYLVAQINAEGHIPSFLHTNWLAAGLFYLMGDMKHTESLLAYLYKMLPKLASSNLAWLLNTLLMVGVSVQHPLIVECLRKLLSTQENDGRWSSEDGEGKHVHTTLEALRAIQLCAVSTN